MSELAFPWELNIEYVSATWGEINESAHSIKFIHNGKIKNSFEELFAIQNDKIEIIKFDIDKYTAMFIEFRVYETSAIPHIKNLYTVANFFRNSKFKSIPEDLFKYNPQIKEFVRCFEDCKNLETLPNKLFAYNHQADNFFSTFGNCTSLKSIPGDIFSQKNLCRQHFNYCFEECTSLKEVPTNLFKYVNNENLRYAFHNCINLETINSNAFSNTTTINKTYFKEIFNNCNNLKNIPTDLLFQFL